MLKIASEYTVIDAELKASDVVVGNLVLIFELLIIKPPHFTCLSNTFANVPSSPEKGELWLLRIR
jgi:hypothetical protein